MDNKKLSDAFKNVKFDDRDAVFKARDQLGDIDGNAVINYLVEEANFWDWSDVFYGVKNIEDAFLAKFSTDWLINLFFGEEENWSSYGYGQMLKNFNEYTGRQVTADDVVRAIDFSFLQGSVIYDVGIVGFFRFIEENNGDPKVLVSRIAENITQITHDDMKDIVFILTPYVEPGDLDAEVLYNAVSWKDIDQNGWARDAYYKLFEKIDPTVAECIVRTQKDAS